MIVPPCQELLDRGIFVLVKAGKEFLAPYTPEAKARIAEEGGYPSAFASFLERVLTALRGSHWAAGTYFPGGLFRQLEEDKLGTEGHPLTSAMFSRFYVEAMVVDPEGKWWVGAKKIEGAVLEHFLRSLDFDPALQRYRVRYWLESYFETRYIHHRSPPFRVERVETLPDGYLLGLNDGGTQPLLPASLRMDTAERLYCAIRELGLPAVFEDNARWRMLDLLEERGGGWVLPWGGREIPLRLDGPLDFPGKVDAGATEQEC